MIVCAKGTVKIMDYLPRTLHLFQQILPGLISGTSSPNASNRQVTEMQCYELC